MFNTDKTTTAVILAAGIGSRMGSHTEARPKCLLEIAPGATVLGLQIERLLETARIGRIVVVTGYRHDLVEKWLRSSGYAHAVELVFNPFYEVSNNLHSLWLARQHLGGGAVIVNGDDVFAPGLLERALAAPGDLVVTVNRKLFYDHDDMKVVVADGRILRIGKDVPLDGADAEAIGVIRASAAGAAWLVQAMDSIVREGNRNVFYLRAMQRVIDSGKPVGIADITSNPWGEIDEPADLARLQDQAEVFAWTPPLQKVG